MKNISLFKNFITGIGSLSLAQIIKEIRGNDHKGSVLKIRKLVETGDLEKADQLKKELVAFTVSGLFEGGPRMVFLKTYNPFVILDINNLDPHYLRYLIFKIKYIEFTKAVFVSPGGRGLKIIVQVDSKMKMHNLACHQVRDFYEDRLAVEIEKNGNNISRLCFMSHDPGAYFNSKSTVYKIEIPEIKTEKSLSKKILAATSGESLKPVDDGADLTSDYSQAFTTCVIETNSKSIYKQGNRNNYIYELGILCKCAGIPLDVAIAESNKAFDLSKNEIKETIGSAYNWKSFESTKKSIKIPVKFPPAIPSQIYDKLPALLKESCSPFRDRHQERDAFLTGALGILSGLLPGVSGTYNGQSSYPNLFVFVVAPPASGKGAFYLARYLGTAYGNNLSKANEKKNLDYKKALIKFEVDSMIYEKGDLVDEPKIPEEPDFRYLFIPTNVDPYRLIVDLKRNGDSGVLFDSSTIRLGNALNQYQDEYPNLLERAFHHKSIVSNPESEGDIVEVSHPKLSVSLSGTPYELTKFIPLIEDDLLAKFMFYTFKNEAVWRDVSPRGLGPDLQVFYEDLSEDVLEMIHFLETSPAEFTLTKAQWEMLNSTFKTIMEETKQNFGMEALRIVRKMGLICFRIAMILSTIRKFEEKRTETKLVCSNDDFQVAIWLAKNYLKHGLFVYDRSCVSPGTIF